MGCKNCENVEICVFLNWNPPKKTFAKTLRKLCEKLRLSQYFAKFVSIRTTRVTRRRGKCTPTTGSAKTVENPRNAMLFACCLPYFRKEVCCEIYDISQIYFALFLNFCNYYQLLFSQIPAFSICRAARNNSAPDLHVSTACHNFSADEGCTLSWTQNSSGNPHARIYTPWSALSLPQMVATYQDIVLSPVPCQYLHHCDNWETNCCPSLLSRSSTKKKENWINKQIGQISKIVCASAEHSVS